MRKSLMVDLIDDHQRDLALRSDDMKDVFEMNVVTGARMPDCHSSIFSTSPRSTTLRKRCIRN